MQTETPLQPWLTVHEVAALLRVSRPEVYRLIKTGDLAPVEGLPYRKTLFRREIIAQFMGVSLLQPEVS